MFDSAVNDSGCDLLISALTNCLDFDQQVGVLSDSDWLLACLHNLYALLHAIVGKYSGKIVIKRSTNYHYLRGSHLGTILK